MGNCLVNDQIDLSEHFVSQLNFKFGHTCSS